MDGRQLVAELNATVGTDLEFVGVAELGVVSGAVYVRWPDGRDGVLTTSPAPASFLRLVGGVLDLARAHGAPVPRYELVVELADSSVIVQERLPGSPVQLVDEAAIDGVVAANEKFAGLLSDQPDVPVPVPELHLRESGPDFCLHETLARYGDRSRRLLGWIREVGGSAPATLTGDDLVHWDLVPGNILVSGSGEVTGIVDWDGIGRGDRRFALIKLRFSLERGSVLRPDGYPEVSAGAVARLDEQLENLMDLETFRRYWAHWSLSMVDWSIRHHPQADIDLYLDLATSRID